MLVLAKAHAGLLLTEVKDTTYDEVNLRGQVLRDGCFCKARAR